MKKRNKIVISAMSGLLATTSVVIPLSSCSNQKYESTFYQTIDKQYGVTEATYNKLKQSFRSEIEAYKETHTPEEAIWAEEEYKTAIENFDKLCTTNKYGWTALTSTVVDYARNTFGFKLARQSAVKWSQLPSIYNGMSRSLRTYMESNKLSPTFISKILTESRARFDTIEKNLKAKYGNDALGGMIEAKKQIITCFEDANDEIALVSSTQRLADFFDEYQFEFDSNEQENNCLDTFTKEELSVDQPISDGVMNRLFKITKKSQPEIEDITFESNKMIPMFTIIPKLKEIQDDKVSNTHVLSIDFSLVKSYYLTKYKTNPEKLQAVTAHLRNPNPVTLGQQIENATKTLAEMINDMPIITMDFPVQITSAKEQENIKEVFFNPDSEAGHITFNWPTDIDKQAYEAFFEGTKKEGDNHWKGVIDEQVLCNAGLEIAYEKNEPHYERILEYVRSGKEKVNLWTNGGGDDIKMNLAESFMAHCDICSDVDITEKTDESGNHNTVKNLLRISYKNSSYRKREAEWKVTADCPADYALSIHYYDLTNSKFNQVDSYIKSFKENHFNTFKHQAKALDFLEGLALAANLIGLGFVVFVTIYSYYGAPLDGIKLRTFAFDMAVMLVAIISFIFVCVNYNHIKTKYIEPQIEFAKRVDEFANEINNHPEKYPLAYAMMAEIDSYGQKYFVIINDDGSYNQSEYNNKSIAFRKLGSEAFEINRYFSTVNQSEGMKQFVEAQEAKRADLQNMHNTFGKWLIGNDYWQKSLVLDLLTGFLSLVTFALKKVEVRMIKEWIFKKSKSLYEKIRTREQLEMPIVPVGSVIAPGNVIDQPVIPEQNAQVAPLDVPPQDVAAANDSIQNMQVIDEQEVRQNEINQKFDQMKCDLASFFGRGGGTRGIDEFLDPISTIDGFASKKNILTETIFALPERTKVTSELLAPFDLEKQASEKWKRVYEAIRGRIRDEDLSEEQRDELREIYEDGEKEIQKQFAEWSKIIRQIERGEY